MSECRAMTESWLAQHLLSLGWTILPKSMFHRGNGINATLGKYTISLQASYGPYSEPRKDGCRSYTAIEIACWNGRTADGLRWVHTSYHSDDDVCPYLSKAQVLGFIAKVTQLAKR